MKAEIEIVADVWEGSSWIDGTYYYFVNLGKCLFVTLLPTGRMAGA